MIIIEKKKQETPLTARSTIVTSAKEGSDWEVLGFVDTTKNTRKKFLQVAIKLIHAFRMKDFRRRKNVWLTAHSFLSELRPNKAQAEISWSYM